LTVPLKDSIYSFGNDFLFLFDREMKLQKFETNGNLSLKSIRKKDNHPNFTIIRLFAGGQNTNNFKPLVPLFYKYRRFHHNLRLTELYSSINKRSLIYDAEKNEITIKLFPIER